VTLLRAALGTFAVAIAVVAYRVQVDNLHSPWQRSAATVAIGLAFIASGLIAWARRPGNRLGPIMVAAGYALLLRQLRYSESALLFTVFFVLGDLWYVLVGHAALAYPTGRVRGRAEGVFVRVAYVAALALPLALVLFYDGTRPLPFFHSASPKSLVLVDGNEDVVSALHKALVVVYALIAATFLVLVARKLVLASARGRRLLLPLMLAAIAIAFRALFECGRTFLDTTVANDYLFWWQIVALLALPLALLGGLLRARLARASVGELLLALERTPTDGLRDAVARAVGDDSLELAFWLPERRGYVDASGRPVELPATAERAVTLVEDHGRPLAALVHDPTLLDEPQLIQAVSAAARLALENARLNAELSAQLAAVKESRARIVAAADQERRRIERDIHDGSQQRLVALAVNLRAAQRRLGEGASGEMSELLDATVEQLQAAVDELRELARGVHPAILTEAGLGGALEFLARRTPLIVSIDDGSDGRMPPEVEATAYFVACEALANVVKHAHATRATIAVERVNGSLVIGIDDDGVGGAKPADGSGLSGLSDRVEALGGRLVVEDAPGGGTSVRAEIPCAS
jgi:signal transduction histidine kinase